MVLVTKICSQKWNIPIIILIAINISNLKGSEENERPIVGIPTMVITDKLLLKTFPKLENREYIAASYVKLIEMAGGQVVPIPIKINDTELKYVFNSVNGILFPGGETNLVDSGYYKLTKKLFKMAINENSKGNIFPILGICRGMQALAVHLVDSISPLVDTDSVNYTTNLKWNKEAFSSSIFKDMPQQIYDDSEEYDITSHFHIYGISPSAFDENSKIGKAFKLLATSKDRGSKEFASVIEGKELPFYGMQFHPEKILFEWSKMLKIPHTRKAINLAQFMANTFLDQVRKNTENSFKDFDDEQMYTISKTPPFYSGFLKNSHTPFTQIYIF